MFQALLLTHALSILYMEGQTMKRSYLSKPFSVTDDDFHGLLGQYETEIHKAAMLPLSHQEVPSLCKVKAVIRQRCFQLYCAQFEFKYRKPDCSNVVIKLCSYTEKAMGKTLAHMLR